MEYLEVKDRIEQLEREYHYYLGLATIPPFTQNIQMFQDKMGLSEEEIDERRNRILELLADGRTEGRFRPGISISRREKPGRRGKDP